MSASIILTQIIIIFLLILVGAVLYKLKIVNEDGSRQLSGIVVNVTNPAVLICSAITDSEKEPLGDLLLALLCFVGVFAVLMIVAYLLPLLLYVEKGDRYSYRMLTLFGNVGFIGIPLASALLGSKSLIYISVCNLVFNFLAYTYAYSQIEAAARRQKAEAEPSMLLPTGDNRDIRPAAKRSPLRMLLNAGTVSCIITIILYVSDIHVPDVFSQTLDYCGKATTLLSMLVLGTTLAQMVPKELFTHWKLYFFVVIRQIIIPILIILAFKPLIKSELLLAVIAIEFSVPAANTPLMFSKQLGAREDTIAHGILMTTLFSLITIPLVFLFL